MKVLISLEENIDETEVVIKCKELTDEVLNIQKTLCINHTINKVIKAKKEETEFFIELEDILFFEAFGRVIVAHTKEDSFTIKEKLYEVEQMVPRTFIRVSKSAIVNAKLIYSINKSLVSTGIIQFKNSKKETSVSRSYYKMFNERMDEVRI